MHSGSNESEPKVHDIDSLLCERWLFGEGLAVTSEVKTQGVGQNSQVFPLYKCSGRCYFRTKILFCKTHIASFLMSINRATECWLMHFPSLPVLRFFNGTF